MSVMYDNGRLTSLSNQLIQFSAPVPGNMNNVTLYVTLYVSWRGVDVDAYDFKVERVSQFHLLERVVLDTTAIKEKNNILSMKCLDMLAGVDHFFQKKRE